MYNSFIEKETNMPNKNQPKTSNEGYLIKLKAGLYIISLVVLSVTLISLFSKSQSKESILGLFAMAFTVILIVVFLVIRQKPEQPSQKWLNMDNPIVAISVSIIVNLIWYLLIQPTLS